jgi:hypothetical protein
MGNVALTEFVGVCEEVGEVNQWGKGSAKFNGTWYSMEGSLTSQLRQGSSYAIGWRPTQKPASSGGGPGKPRIENVSPVAGAQVSAAQSGNGGVATVDGGGVTMEQKQKSIELQVTLKALTPLMGTLYDDEKALAAATNTVWGLVFKANVDKVIDKVKADLDAEEEFGFDE